MASKIVRGDDVRVITGDHRGSVGKILRVIDEGARVLVAGVNIGNRILKKKTGKQVVMAERPIHISNVMLLDRKTSSVSRIGFKIFSDGVKKRVLKTSQEVLD